MYKATEEKIQEWKDKYGDIFKITTEDGYSCILRKPNRKELGYAGVAGQENPIKFNEIILNSCWLGGDEEIKTDDSQFLSVSQKLGEIIKVKSAELEKL